MSNRIQRKWWLGLVVMISGCGDENMDLLNLNQKQSALGGHGCSFVTGSQPNEQRLECGEPRTSSEAQAMVEAIDQFISQARVAFGSQIRGQDYDIEKAKVATAFEKRRELVKKASVLKEQEIQAEKQAQELAKKKSAARANVVKAFDRVDTTICKLDRGTPALSCESIEDLKKIDSAIAALDVTKVAIEEARDLDAFETAPERLLHQKLLHMVLDRLSEMTAHRNLIYQNLRNRIEEGLKKLDQWTGELAAQKCVFESNGQWKLVCESLGSNVAALKARLGVLVSAGRGFKSFLETEKDNPTFLGAEKFVLEKKQALLSEEEHATARKLGELGSTPQP